MSCGHRTGEFNAYFPEDYPDLPDLKPDRSFTANAASLLERVNRIKYATCKPGQKTDERSTCIHFSGNRIFCLDGLRAAWDTDEALTVPVPFMIPAASSEYLKLFGNQNITIQMGNHHVEISDGALRLRLRRVEAMPFDLDSAIPRTSREEVLVYPRDFLAELTYLKEAAPGTQQPYVCFDGGRLSMQVNGCRYQTRIQMDGRSGISIGFNLRYLADALRQFKGEPCVRMKLNTPVSPIVLEAEGRSDCAMVLPVRLKNNMAA